MAAKIKSYNSSNHKHKPKGVSTREFHKVHWPYLPIMLVIFLLLSIVIQSHSISAVVRNPNSKVLAYATSMSISGLLTSTNSARASNGASALSLNSKLNAAAQAKANDMASRNYWSHNTPEGNPPWVFVTAQGYSYQKIGENLAAGFADEQSTINGWMASPPHKENMLDSAFSEVGFGFANNPDYTSAGGGPMTIVVAFYGKPTAAAPAPAPQPASPPPAAQKTTPAPASTPVSTPPPAPAATTQPPAPAPQSPTQPQPGSSNDTLQNTTPKKVTEPVTSDNTPHGVTLSLRTSRAQLAFAQLPFSSFASGMAIFGIFAALGLWISRHLLLLRRVVVHGESYIIKHPLIDVGLVVIAALSYIVSQTAGFIL